MEISTNWEIFRAPGFKSPLGHPKDNPARKVDKPRRLPSTRRAVADTGLAEINQVAATTGDDPDPLGHQPFAHAVASPESRG
jgi:hypothetical protein